MDEQVVTEVLDACGDNIDAAIKRLGELSLSANRACPAAASSPAGGTAHVLGASAASPGEKASAREHQQSAAPEKRTLQEWVDALVRHISEAQGVEDARTRASQVLHAFQHALALAHRKEADDVMRERLGELTRENSILKRAVAIQAQRIQGASNSSAHETMRLRSQVAEYEAKLHSLELSNFSLAMHLKAATGSAGIGLANGRPPDVF